MPLFTLLYASRATRTFDDADLLDLLRHARAANERRGVTGMLLHAQGRFMQVLEGERDVVLDLLAAIRRDPRHEAIVVTQVEAIDERRFGDWTMGFVHADRYPGEPGLNRVVNAANGLASVPGAAWDLMLSIRALAPAA
jgi:hypothetical protein